MQLTPKGREIVALIHHYAHRLGEQTFHEEVMDATRARACVANLVARLAELSNDLENEIQVSHMREEHGASLLEEARERLKDRLR